MLKIMSTKEMIRFYVITWKRKYYSKEICTEKILSVHVKLVVCQVYKKTNWQS